MSLSFNNTEIKNITYNGTELTKVIYNGVIVWEKAAAAFDYSNYYEFAGLLGTTHFLLREARNAYVWLVNTTKFEKEKFFAYAWNSSNNFMAIKNGVLYCDTYGNDYSATNIANWTVRRMYRSTDGTLSGAYNTPLRGDVASTIERNYASQNGLDFDTLWADMYAINYTSDKLVTVVKGDYCIKNDTGSDSWSDDYRDIYIIETPIIDGMTLNHNGSTIIMQFRESYCINEPESYEDFSENWYYNTYTQDLYEICSREDNDGDTIEFFRINNQDVDKWGGLSATQISTSNIIRDAIFSFKGTDATLSVPYSTLNGSLNVYVFNESKLIKSTLTDSSLFTGTTNNLAIKYNGENIFVANTVKKTIKKLYFNENTFSITL